MGGHQRQRTLQCAATVADQGAAGTRHVLACTFVIKQVLQQIANRLHVLADQQGTGLAHAS